MADSRVIRRLRESARGQQCAIRIPGVCCFDPETTVLAHINSVGKGMGIKSEDWFGIFCCVNCHACLDTHTVPKDVRYQYILSALYETWKTWIKTGLVRV